MCRHRNIYLILFLLLSTILVTSSNSNEIFDYKINIYVFDEANKPIENASVIVMYYSYKKHEFGTVTGLTDKNGLYIYNGKFHKDVVEYTISKDGYYRSSSDFAFSEEWLFAIKDKLAAGQKKFFVMRAIENPLFVGKDLAKTRGKGWFCRIIPILDQEIGFDAMVTDWVNPFGKGKVSDFFVKFSKEVNGKQVRFAKAEIRFNNKDDGILPIDINNIFVSSEFQTPRTAPVNGYINKIEVYHPATERGYNELKTFRLKRDKKFYYDRDEFLRYGHFNYSSASGYFYFKIRGGQHYGIIRHGINFGQITYIDTAEFEMTLFLNPNINQNNIEIIGIN